MAQLRQDYQQFLDHNTEVIAVGPESQKDFKKFWEKNNMPFIGLADPQHDAARLYEQEVTFLKFGRIPAEILIDQEGIVRYAHYAQNMADIKKNSEILSMIKEINESMVQFS